MKPNTLENFAMESKKIINNEVPTEKQHTTDYKLKIVWRNVIVLSYIHLSFFYGLYLILFYAKIWTFIWCFFVAYISALGITAGAHRLWCHRSYKAKWPLRLIFIILQTVALQNHVYDWVRDHRMHHKFTDTDADPHNSRRGFFFSHIGWLMVRKHPDIISKGATINMSDLDQDPLVVFQKKWYPYLILLFCFIMPTVIPCWAWGENFWCAWHINIVRYCYSLNGTWLVNSAAHTWGAKPYDKSLSSTDSIAMFPFAISGEFWHNYHHTFPWDYKVAESGNYMFNWTTGFIDFFAYLGLAYDLKTVPKDVVKKRILRNSEMSY